MKLELKNLAPYFPYGLKVRIYSDSNSPIMDNEVYGYEYEHLLFIDGLAKLEYCKPILRPLSDLTKWAEEYYNFLKLDETNKYDLDYLCEMNGDISNQLRYDMLLWLFENHFDVFGLIEKGLAIDINTIIQID